MISFGKAEAKVYQRSEIRLNHNKIKVLIVDDDNFVREYLKQVMATEPELEVVGTAVNGKDGIEQVNSLQPNVVLMDLAMPEIDGVKATKIICNRFPQARVLVLSSFDTNEYIAASLQAGAKGYLFKNTPAEKLVASVKAVHAGCPQIAPEIYENITELFDQPQDLITPNNVVALKQEANLPPSLAHGTNRLKKNKLKKNKFKLYSGLTLLLVAILSLVGTRFNQNWSLISQAVSTGSQGNSATKIPQRENLLAVKATRIEPVDSYQVVRSYTGRVIANRSSELSFETTGKLVDLKVKEGDLVEPGTPLAVLDTRNLQASKRELEGRKAQAVARLQELQAGSRPEDIAAAQAVVNRWQQQLKLERRRSSRRQSLYSQGAISREQLDEAVTSESSIQAQLDEAASQLEALQTGSRPETIAAQQGTVAELDAGLENIAIELNKSVLKAPFKGVISAREVDEGTVVSPGQKVFNLVENDALEARIGIPVNRVQQITVGDTLPLTVGQKTYAAQVSSLLPELDRDTLTTTVVLALDSSASQEVISGQLARLELSQTVATSGYWLPTTALVKGKRSLWFSYVLQEPTPEQESSNPDVYAVERRLVEVLHTQSDRVLVRGTLKPEEKVITNGLHRLVPGQLVTHKSS
ncbi:MAG: efflux RND transporter periplasmic adaptor subunit [Cyanobacteria bacterium J06623_1]